jgi:hypothetical protein
MPAHSVPMPSAAMTTGMPAPGKTMFRTSASAGAAMTGRNEATLRSVFRMPKILPRTVTGSS